MITLDSSPPNLTVLMRSSWPRSFRMIWPVATSWTRCISMLWNHARMHARTHARTHTHTHTHSHTHTTGTQSRPHAGTHIEGACLCTRSVPFRDSMRKNQKLFQHQRKRSYPVQDQLVSANRCDSTIVLCDRYVMNFLPMPNVCLDGHPLQSKNQAKINQKQKTGMWKTRMPNGFRWRQCGWK